MYLTDETKKQLLGAANILKFASMRLRVLGDTGNSKIVDSTEASIRYFLSCNEEDPEN